jgi:protein-L-isoaspartate(D-aspartate) O-methyltransferase
MSSWPSAYKFGIVSVAILALCVGLQTMHPSRDPGGSRQSREEQGGQSDTPASSDAGENPEFSRLRQEMVSQQLQSRGIDDERVLAAMLRVPRHAFVAKSLAATAYEDCPQRIGSGQTISQPYIVGLMTQLARVTPESKVLDVGTGSGYQAAILGELCREVFSVEIVAELAEDARQRLAALGYDRITLRHGDGYRGWPEQAPYDAIIVAAAPDHIPPRLVEQLAVGGRLVIPVGDSSQELLVIERQSDRTTRQWKVVPVTFVPMTGEAQHLGGDN